ncbi:MAG: hypothetical protein RJQ14_25120 [Marinoscillum sp.]
MRKIINTNFTAKSFVLVVCVTLLAFISSCGDDGNDTQTPKEVTIEALKGSWAMSADSELANLTIDPSTVGISISETGFSLSGDITSYVDGGSFTVDESGSLTDISVNITNSDLELDGSPAVKVENEVSKITVSFTAKQSSSRVSGIGAFVLVMVKAS